MTVNVTRFAVFKEEPVGVAQLHLHGHYFLLLSDGRIAAVYELRRAALHLINFSHVGFI